jgi:phosphotransferase family enzyme
VAVGTSHVGTDFDPHLPQLPLVFDLDSVGALFERHWTATCQPEAAHVSVTARALKDVKYQPGIGCVSTYELIVGHGGDRTARAIGVLHVDAEGVRVARPEEDPELDRLGEAMDPEYMRDRLESAPEFKTELTGLPRITLLRYKPRLRCALRYDLPTPSGDEVLFGKMLAEGGENTMLTLSQLHRRSLEQDKMPRIAPPLLYWPDHRLLLQQAVDGDEFHSMVFDNQTKPHDRARWMTTAGERLAGLHSANDPRGPHRTLREDVEELSEYTPAIAASDPQLADLYSVEVRRVAMRAGDASGTVPSHGAFRTDQFMIRGGELVLIDLDGYCWADPARDIGNMFAYLRWRSIRQPDHGPFVELAKSSFLEGYGSTRDLPGDRQVALFEAASLLKIAGRRYRGLTWTEWHLVPRLIRDSRHLLDR